MHVDYVCASDIIVNVIFFIADGIACACAPRAAADMKYKFTHGYEMQVSGMPAQAAATAASLHGVVENTHRQT